MTLFLLAVVAVLIVIGWLSRRTRNPLDELGTCEEHRRVRW
jgi:hypothetical protein